MRKYLINIFNAANIKLPYLKEASPTFTVPNQKNHGDYATNVALIIGKILKRNPSEIAGEIINSLDYDSQIIEKIEPAGPGFINFYFTPSFNSNIIKEILVVKDNFGRSNKYSGKKAIVEFVSANPTGPLTVGHGRNAVIGDTISSMLEWVGYEVDREYYFNNAGRQMRSTLR